jgi:hypothetical protein
MNPPVDFEERAKRAPGSTTGDYPYAIKGRDLMQNFVYATLVVDDALIEETPGIGGHAQRRLKIPAPPVSNTTYVLTAKSGQFQWLETEACD